MLGNHIRGVVLLSGSLVHCAGLGLPGIPSSENETLIASWDYDSNPGFCGYCDVSEDVEVESTLVHAPGVFSYRILTPRISPNFFWNEECWKSRNVLNAQHNSNALMQLHKITYHPLFG